MNRREFLLAAAVAPVALRYAAAATPLAFATADLESHVAVVDLQRGMVVKRIETLPSPFSIERVGDRAVVAHTVSGAVTILDSRRLAVAHVVHGIAEPRYTASAGDGRHAFVTDSGRSELVTLDVLRGEIVGRLKLTQWPRHLSLSPDRRTVWLGLGTASPVVDVVDVSDPRRLVHTDTVKPPFLAHDVAFAPSGRVWITAGEARSITVHGGPVLAADGAPQHVTFMDGRAYVASGASGTLRVYDEQSARLLTTTRIPAGSFNVQFAGGRVLTPSLQEGTLCVLDRDGRTMHRVHVASSSHDACLAR